MSVRSLILGVDINRVQPQLCFYDRATKETVTAPMKIGNEEVSFQTILDRIEAEPSEEEKNVLVEETADLFRQSFGTIGLSDPEEQIGGMMVTVPKLTKAVVELMRLVFQKCAVNRSRAWLQDYKESFYFHTLYQKEELWSKGAELFWFAGKKVSCYSLQLNRRTRPVTVHVRKEKSLHLMGDEPGWDSQFSGLLEDVLQGKILSGIFLAGETFQKSWAKKSTRILCQGGRRVYAVDHLFARGACFAAQERVMEKQLSRFFYLGEDLVRYNVGMDMLVDGREIFYPMISAGVNWYEAHYSCECLLDGEKELIFQVSRMDNGHKFPVRMELNGLPDRPPRTTRLKLQLSFSSPTELQIEAEDLGFGELYPASGQIWRETMEDKE